ncbi:MAG: MarR family transcriptional regulator [Flavobacteriales bacterium]|nr:MarR family transcriptional regulator [Flavobacteriales bacterium]
MEEIKLTEKQKELIEKLGVFLERSGISPAQARVMGLLLVADRVELTFDEIRGALQLSKSATSNALNTLMQFEKITYITKTGDRKRYFKTVIATQKSDFQKRFKQFLSMKEIYSQILEARTPDTPKFNAELAQVVDFMEFMEEQLPEIFAKWKAKKK